MDTMLSTIEKKIQEKNTTTIKQMNDTLTSLTSRVITVERDVSHIKTRVSDMATFLHNFHPFFIPFF
jgi:hypothetical protein